MAEGFYELLHRDQAHTVPLEKLFGILDTSHQGLNPQQVAERIEQYGKNAIKEKKRTPFIIKYGKHLVGVFPALLWVGAFLSFFGEYFQPGEGMLYIGVALLAVIFINASFSYWQESKVEHAMAAFKKMMSTKARVMRNGREREVDASQLVPGDILILAEGDKIPADARLIEVNTLKVNNASLTGESEPQLRALTPTADHYLESRNLIFSGTLVSAGSGKAVVYATGNETELGRIAHVTLETRSVESPMQHEIKHFSKRISIIAVGLGVVFFIIGLLLGNPFWGDLIFAIGIIVANVPEGLLPTVTLALSIASRRMAKKNALIKRLDSVETLGSTTVICTDKTGTLTMNAMRVTNLFLDLKDFSQQGEIDTKDEKKEWVAVGGPHGKHTYSPNPKTREFAVMASVLCNNASLNRQSHHTPKDQENNQENTDGAEADSLELLGDPTETALLLFADQDVAGPNVDWARQAWPRRMELPFDSKTKEMITIHSPTKAQVLVRQGAEVAFLKGAPEVVLGQCKGLLWNGKAVHLTKAHRELIEKQNAVYARSGKRVLALAYKEVASTMKDEVAIKKEDYVFVGLIAMYDPPRTEVKNAVATCREAGIKIIVVSGDHPLTVGAIAREVGIVREPNPTVLTGEQLAGMSHTALKEALGAKEIILARTSPQDKMRVVGTLQEMGHVVAVTGDGVNDAPALKKADIGVAMGVSGTDVAKEAADMVLMDDNFSTIVNAVEEGRVIYSNIRKFVAYILTSNVPEIVPFLAFVLLGIPLPLTVVLILAIDLGTDLLPALGLATERAEYAVMKVGPRDRKERLMSGRLLFMSYGIIGMLQAAAGFTSYFAVLFSGGWHWGQELAFSDPLYRMAIGAFFISIIVSQIATVLICRTRRDSVFTKGLFSNRLVMIGIAAELAFTAILIYTPFGHVIFNTASLPGWVWLIPIPFALTILAGDEFRKFLRRAGNQFVERWLTW